MNATWRVGRIRTQRAAWDALKNWIEAKDTGLKDFAIQRTFDVHALASR